MTYFARITFNASVASINPTEILSSTMMCFEKLRTTVQKQKNVIKNVVVYRGNRHLLSDEY